MNKPRSGTYLDNLPDNLYHNKDHGFSSSDLKKIVASTPQHFKYEYDQGKLEPTEAMRTGTVLHCGLLRPEQFDKEVIQLPTDWNLRTNVGKASKKHFIERHSDKQVVNQKELDLGMAMVEAVKNNDEAMLLIWGSIKERSFYADIMGTPFRARADAYKKNLLIELKSAKNASQDGFSRQIGNLKYHVSLCHYAAVMAESAPEKSELHEYKFRFIVVENFTPHVVAVYKPSERMIQVGWELWKTAVEKLQSCLELNTWPGYTEPGIVEEIDLQNWDVPKEEE